MTTQELFTTAAMMRILGIRSRQTIYTLQLEPTSKSPGVTGQMWWSKDRIVEIGEAHNRTPDWGAA